MELIWTNLSCIETYQVSIFKVVEHLNVSLLRLLLLFVHPFPERVHAAHIQHFVRINLPCVAVQEYINLIKDNGN